MTAKPFNFGRLFVYGVLLLAALFFLAPLYVMIVTSLRTPTRSAPATC
jgi:glucose/mannose transport system permease protein